MLFSYLRDRSMILLGLVFSYVVMAATAILIFIEKKVSIPYGALFYVFLLGIFFLAAGTAIDYVRQRSFRIQLKKQLESDSDPLQSGYALASAEPCTKEQEWWVDLILAMNQKYEESLQQMTDKEKQQQTFTNQWIHQMKTPVSVISLLIQEGKQHPGPDFMYQLLNDIEEENETFSSGLDRMLQLSRLEAFSNDIKSEKVDLKIFLTEIINREKRQFIKRKIFPKLNMPDALIVFSDKKWLDVVITQVLQNALKYSVQGEGKEIWITGKEERPNTISLSITDFGQGIPDYDLPRIFDPFYTGSNGRTQKEATGMGLYIAKMVCDQLGHYLTAQSEEKRFTSLTIEFTSLTLHR